MSWRPKDWEAIKERLEITWSSGLFEAGADAVMEALKAEGHYVKGMESVAADDSVLKFIVPKEAGWWVFLPDEEQKGESNGLGSSRLLPI